MDTSSDPVEMLRRWADVGGGWRGGGRRRATPGVGLYRCDGGEEVDRLVSSDPDLRRYVGDRGDSQS